MLKIIRYINNNIVKKSLIAKIYMFSLILFICSLVVIYKIYGGYIQVDNANNVTSYKYTYELKKEEVEETVKSENMQKLELLQSINPDIVALIKIDGTNIDYPVTQTEDNTYYMSYNYKKEKSNDGALILDKACDLLKPSTNILIYGHNNIGSNQMFADLVKYKNKEFYEKHKIINFTTNTEDSVYEIISVFLSQVYYKSQKDAFKYYFFVDAKDEQEFNEFITNSKKFSLYNIDKTARYGDNLMTLSTCEYSRINGRLAVVAKKIK